MNTDDRDLDMRIARRWPHADAFYRERDDRTARVSGDVARFAARPIAILIDPFACNSPTVQRIALTAANLTSRWARRVHVVVPNGVELAGPLRRGGFTTLSDRIASEMQAADPFGDFVLAPAESAHTSETLRLHVGPWRQGGPSGDDYHVWAAGWSALARRGEDAVSLESTAEATAPAGALAASLGAADLFKRAVGHSRDWWLGSLSWDTWSTELLPNSWVMRPAIDVPEPVDIGRVLLAGVGAIGSAFLYILDMSPVTSEITLLDRDCVDVTNLNRSPLFRVSHALDGACKTDACAAFLAGRLAVRSMEGSWREHAAAIRSTPFDVWISLTNEDAVWAELPFQLPPAVLHATTTSEWGFGAGRHIPRVEDCTLCRMPRPEAEFRGPCAEGEIAQGDRPAVRAALPFLSTAAASLLLAELMQLSVAPGSAAEFSNDISADLNRGLKGLVALRRGPTTGCAGCTAAQSQASFSTRRGTKFENLSFTP